MIKSEGHSVTSYFKQALDIFVWVYGVIIAVIIPLYFTDGYRHIGTDKADIFRVASLVLYAIIIPIMLGLYFCRFISEKKKNPFDFVKSNNSLVTVSLISALSYGFTALISFGTSPYLPDLVWGEEGWFMGILPTLFMVGIFIMTACSNFGLEIIGTLLFFMSGLQSFLCILSRFSLLPIELAGKKPGYVATIGNINWFCGYLVIIAIAGLYLMWKGKKWAFCYCLVVIPALIVQGSASGILALLVVLFVFFYLSGKSFENMNSLLNILICIFFTGSIMFAMKTGLGLELNFDELHVKLYTSILSPIFFLAAVVFKWLVIRWEGLEKYPDKVIRTFVNYISAAVVVLAVCYIHILIINTLMAGGIIRKKENKFFVMTYKWGSARGGTWLIGGKTFGEQNLIHKLWGVGPDGMWSYIWNNGSEELKAIAKDLFGKKRLTNAHNEMLTILVNQGIVGLAGFLATMGTGIAACLKTKNEYAKAFGIGVIACMVNNIFSFEQTIATTTMFLVLGLGVALARQETDGLR